MAKPKQEQGKPQAPPDPKVAQQARENLQAAVARLVVSHGFFAGPVLRMNWHPVGAAQMAAMGGGSATIGTDGCGNLYYSTEYIAACTLPECIALLVHEACHDLGLHPFRKQTRDHLQWNIACDAVVNQVVRECSLTLPEGGVPAVPDTTPEALYEKIQKQKKKQAPCQCSLLKPKGKDGKDLEGAALSQAEAEARLGAATVAELGKRAGNLPAGLARLVGAALEERVSWERIVSRFVTDSGKLDSSWRKVNRRYLTRGVVLPSLWSPEVPDFVLACDTSGSISDDTLRMICGEVLHALASCEKHGQQSLTVVWCDTEVHTQVVETERDLAPKGGGGTMFSPVFKWVNTHRPATKGVVYATDGYCDDFGPEPEYPVLWVLTAPNDGFTPPFGEIACVMD